MVENTLKPNLIYNDYEKLRVQRESNLSPSPKPADYKAQNSISYSLIHLHDVVTGHENNL